MTNYLSYSMVLLLPFAGCQYPAHPEEAEPPRRQVVSDSSGQDPGQVERVRGPSSLNSILPRYVQLEPRDNAWASKTENVLREALGRDGTTVVRVDCRTRICAVEVTFADSEALMKFDSRDNFRGVPELKQKVATSQLLDFENLRGTLYVTRRGCNLHRGDGRSDPCTWGQTP